MLSTVFRSPLFQVILSGAMLALSFPSPDFGPLAFVALVPLLISIHNTRPLLAFWRGLGCGLIFFACVLSWISLFASNKVGALGDVAGLSLAFVMALFIGVFAAAAAWIQRQSVVPYALKVVAVPSIWVLCEYVRQLGSLGMGWGDIGYTQWRDPAMLHIAPLAGIWGMSWVIVLINTSIASRRLGPVVATFASAALLIGLGKAATRSVHAIGPTFGAAALQANINQDVMWDKGRPADPTYYESTLSTFEVMARNAALSGDKLCVMAETATPGYPRLDAGLRMRMSNIAFDNDIALVAGGRDTNPLTLADRNVAVVYTPDGSPGELHEYAKQQLVPFGEYVPFVDELKWLSVLHVADFNDEPGETSQPPLDAGSGVGKVGVAICYESTYPRFLRQQTLAGANILTVITDDTWFGHTAAARQHLAMSAVRAAECHRYLVRSAATGISALFAPDGRELSEAGLFTKATVASSVHAMAGETLYTRFGDWWVAVCAIVATVTVGLSRSTPNLQSKLSRSKADIAALGD